MDWREFWNRDTTIYVNARHRAVHYETLAREIAAHVPRPDAVVLDFGCGEALSADQVARRAGRLYLCDSSELVRGRLASRFAAHANVTVLSPESLDTVPPRSVDLAVVNSVLQYLPRSECDAVLARLRDRVAPEGRLLVADVIPPGVSPATDALALLRLAARHGFAGAALAGLVRTFFSEYRATRARLGLTHYTEAEMLAVAAAMLRDLRFDRAAMRAAVEEPSGYLLATEAADWLVRRGVSFREAHHAVGQLVRTAESRGVALEALPLADFRAAHRAFDKTVYRALTPEAAVAARKAVGGTSPANVAREVRRWERALAR